MKLNIYNKDDPIPLKNGIQWVRPLWSPDGRGQAHPLHILDSDFRRNGLEWIRKGYVEFRNG